MSMKFLITEYDLLLQPIRILCDDIGLSAQLRGLYVVIHVNYELLPL